MLVAGVALGDLVQVAWVSLGAGVAVAVLYSLVVLGAARAMEARRNGANGAATLNAALAVAAFALFAAAVVLGVQIMLTKQ